MSEHLTYWGSLPDQLRDLLASLPLWELGLYVFCILAAISFAAFGAFLIWCFAVRSLQRASPKARRWMLAGVGVFFIYSGIYFGTTTVRPQGAGGLSGPLRVRVFQNEKHLIVFYPLYLIERWVRNGSFTSAVYYFNIDFKDGQYPHPWLYNDGIYGRVMLR